MTSTSVSLEMEKRHPDLDADACAAQTPSLCRSLSNPDPKTGLDQAPDHST